MRKEREREEKERERERKKGKREIEVVRCSLWHPEEFDMKSKLEETFFNKNFKVRERPSKL